jgi:hypothetical protein
MPGWSWRGRTRRRRGPARLLEHRPCRVRDRAESFESRFGGSDSRLAPCSDGGSRAEAGEKQFETAPLPPAARQNGQLAAVPRRVATLRLSVPIAFWRSTSMAAGHSTPRAKPGRSGSCHGDPKPAGISCTACVSVSRTRSFCILSTPRYPTTCWVEGKHGSARSLLGQGIVGFYHPCAPGSLQRE